MVLGAPAGGGRAGGAVSGVVVPGAGRAGVQVVPGAVVPGAVMPVPCCGAVRALFDGAGWPWGPGVSRARESGQAGEKRWSLMRRAAPVTPATGPNSPRTMGRLPVASGSDWR